MSNLALKLDDEFTYADYLFWDPEEGRYEIIDGVAYAMAAPSVIHQRISRMLLVQFDNFLRGKTCEVFDAPFDVRLFPEEDGSDATVVQPDLAVICDPAKLADGRACKGAPDLIIEILSPGSAVMDRKVKAEKYLLAGVREFWIVNPETLEVQANILTGEAWASTVYSKTVPVFIFPDLVIELGTGGR